MKLCAVVLVILLSGASLGAGQGSPCQPIVKVTAPQRSYAELNSSAVAGRVYLYVPDIKSNVLGRGFQPFTLWIVEGIYGKPFIQPRGTMDEGAFDALRKSPNVRATPVNVTAGYHAKREKFTVGKQALMLEIVQVNVSLGGTDSVTVRVCR